MGLGLGFNRVRVRVRVGVRVIGLGFEFALTSCGGGGSLCLLGLRLGDLVELEEGGEGEVVDAALVRGRGRVRVRGER